MTELIPEFIAHGVFTIDSRKYGKLTVHTGRCPADFRDRSRAAGFVIMFEGQPRRIRMLESYAKLLGPNVGEPVGIVFHD